jgi:superfamily II DNA/RNA helicase
MLYLTSGAHPSQSVRSDGNPNDPTVCGSYGICIRQRMKLVQTQAQAQRRQPLSSPSPSSPSSSSQHFFFFLALMPLLFMTREECGSSLLRQHQPSTRVVMAFPISFAHEGKPLSHRVHTTRSGHCNNDHHQFAMTMMIRMRSYIRSTSIGKNTPRIRATTRTGTTRPMQVVPDNDNPTTNKNINDEQLAASSSTPVHDQQQYSRLTAQEQLQRTRQHLEKLQRQQPPSRRNVATENINDIKEQTLDGTGTVTTTNIATIISTSTNTGSSATMEQIYTSYLVQPASQLKYLCRSRQLHDQGRKPDLASRLTYDDMMMRNDTSLYNMDDMAMLNSLGKNNRMNEFPDNLNNLEGNALKLGLGTDGQTVSSSPLCSVTTFAGIDPLSETAQAAFTDAQFIQPTIIQQKAIPILMSKRSAILHAATGSGKTLAYLLPFTEQLWRYRNNNHINGNDPQKVAFILTPTRELAAQVAGIASILAPPGTVRFVTRPCNLLRRSKQEIMSSIQDNEIQDTPHADNDSVTRIYVGSAKVIYQSLYGDGRMPAPPTTKPEAMFLLQNTEYLVLDEVDRLLGVVGGVNHVHKKKEQSYGKTSKSEDRRDEKTSNVIIHEKPAAILTAAVTRLTLGKVTTVVASATVGRPLRRELSRCMGLSPQECPVIIRDNNDGDDGIDDTKADQFEKVQRDKQSSSSNVVGRAVTIPSTVRHYVIPVVDGTSPGKILTTAFAAIQSLGPNRRMLLVLTRNFGITIQNAIGALKHFRCQPEPISLLDALETTDGAQAMMEVHRQVTSVSGVGGSRSLLSIGKQHQEKGYLLVTGEDSVRGLHLDGLDIVLVASRSVGPDEYTHIAGRTGRAGKSGSVINIVNDVDVSKLTAWENMLNITFIPCASAKAIGSLLTDEVVI